MEMIDKLVDVINPDGTFGKLWVKAEKIEEIIQEVVQTAPESTIPVVEPVSAGVETAHE